MPCGPSAAPVQIVADTNTVLSGLLWQGPPRQIIDQARAGAVTLQTSLTRVAELAEVIGRGKIVRRSRQASFLAARLVEPQSPPVPASRDIRTLTAREALDLIASGIR